MTVAKQVTATRRLWVAAGALGRATAPSLLVAVPPLAGSLVVVAILMGPTGMQPHDVSEAMADEPLVRVAVWVAWLAAFAPAVFELRRAEIAYLRWLPIPAVGFWASWLGVLALLDAPIAIFWWLAGGAPAAVAVLVLTMGFHGALLTRGVARLALAATAAAALLLPAQPMPALAIVGGVVVIVAVPLGWRRALEGRRFALMPLPRGRPWRAIATILLGALAEPMLALRVIVAALVFGGLGGLLCRANSVAPAAAILVAVAVAGLGAVGVATHLANSVISTWRELRWVLRATATAARNETAAILVAVGGVTALAGATTAIVVSAIAGLDLPSSAIATACGAGGAAMVATSATALAARATARQKAQAWIAATVTAALLLALVVIVGALAFIVVPGVLALGVVYTHEVMASAEIDA